MKNKLFSILKYAFFLGIGIGLLYFALRSTNPEKLLNEIKNANYFWVGMSVFFGVFSYYSRAARWLILLEPLGYKPKISNSIYSVFFGYFANIAAPRLGELARCTALNQTEKIPLNTLIGTVILERALDVVILLLLILVAFFINAQQFGQFFLEIFSEKMQSSLNLSFFIYGIIFLGIISFLCYYFRKRIMGFAIAGKISKFLKGVFEGFATVVKMKKKWLFVTHTLIIWGAYIMMTYIGFLAMEETSHLSFADGIFITVVGGIGMAVPANGGIGTFHAAVMFGLAALGVEKNMGLAYATIMHASQVLFILITGIFSFIMLYIEKNKLPKSLSNE